MATINPAPIICCDNCGKQERKIPSNRTTTEWNRPPKWGHIRISPAHWGYYPDNIDMLDVCPDCITAVHAAASKALMARKEQVQS